MRSLFLKIFLWFWLTMLLIALAFVITWSLQPEIVYTRWQSVMAEALATHAQNVADMTERQGPAAALAYLQRLNRIGRMQTSLLNDQDQPVVGKPGAHAAELAARALQNGRPEFEVRPRNAIGVQLATGPSGRRYALVAEMPRNPFYGFHATGTTQVLRWVLAILISGFICYWLTRYLTGPILHLRSAAREIAAGNLGARAGERMEKRRDEFGDLVRDFNQMADRIEALLESQRQLIRDISHELRSPLARLNVALGLARQRSGPEAAAPLDRIEREAERLNEMIGRLLQLARMQAASGPPEKSEVNLRELLTDIADDASFEAQERGCTVHLTDSQELRAPSEPLPQQAETCSVMGSPDLLRSAVENVVRNAVRYTQRGSGVDINLACTDGWATVTVRDHGPGVPDSELANLFRPFYRVADARERETGGTGLGLAITERAVRLHGGTVAVSNAPDGGLLVEMRLPVLPPAE